MTLPRMSAVHVVLLLQGFVCVFQIIGLICYPYLADDMPRMDAPHMGNFATNLFWWGVVLVPAFLPFIQATLVLWFLAGYDVTKKQRMGYSLIALLLALLTWTLAWYGIVYTAMTFD